MEATVGFEPTNRGFADPRLRPLGYVAPSLAGAEEETRLAPSRPVFLRVIRHSPISGTSRSNTVTYYPVPPDVGKYVGKMSAV